MAMNIRRFKKTIFYFIFICSSNFVLQSCDGQLTLLPNLPIFSQFNQNSFQKNPRPKKSPTSSPRIQCCQMVQVTSDGIGERVQPGIASKFLVKFHKIWQCKNEVLNKGMNNEENLFFYQQPTAMLWTE